MTRKLPADAFETYVGMGDARTYQAIADKFGVSKRAVTKKAVAENWSDRLSRIESEARVITDKKLTETMAEMQERHSKTLRVMHARVVTALREYPLDSCMDAIRAAETIIKLERLMAGEVSKRTELSIEETTKREIHTLLTVVRPEDKREARILEAIPVRVGAGVSDGGQAHDPVRE